MKRLIAVVCLAALLATGAISETIAGPKEEAFSAVEHWAAAYNSADVDKVVASYTPDAVFWGTTMENLATTPDGIRAYFAELPKRSPRSSVRILDYSAVQLSNDAVLFAGLYQFSRGEQASPPTRFTFVAVKRGDLWLLAHHHSSSRPTGTGR
jgi:uncharacterized protein (TIGR02246 family)